VNKPFLPIAAGEMSKRAAWATVLFCGSVGSLIVSRLFSPIIFQLYMFGLVIGYARVNDRRFMKAACMTSPIPALSIAARCILCRRFSSNASL